MNSVKDRKMKIVSLTNYLIDLHSAKRSIVFILLASAIAGSLGSAFMGGLDAVPAGMLMGLFFIAAPALLAGLATSLVSYPTLKVINYRRSFYLAFFSSIILSVLYLVGAVLPTGVYGILDILVFGYVLVFIIRSTVMKVTYPYSIFQSISLGSLQSLAGYAAILSAALLVPSVHIGLSFIVLKVALSLVVFAMGIALFVVLINAPMKKNFGINTFEVVSAFLENWFDQSTTIEDVLKKIGEKADILIGLFSFRAKGKIKSLFIVPYVHPGPFGDVGGGKLTRVFMEKLENETKLFIAHGTATHDLNPITTSSLDLMVQGIRKNLRDIKYYKTATNSVRAQKGGAKLIGQKFGNSLFLASTFSPNATEDIDFSIGLAVMNQIKPGYGEVVYADCHNCHKHGDHSIFSGNPVMFDLLDGVKLLDAKIKKERDYRVRLGMGIDPLKEYSNVDGVGPMGLRVTVIETNGQKTAYVNFDANNIVAGLRERIIEELKKIGLDEVEVMTTDSHCVNSIRGVENPLGMKIRKELLVKRAVIACRLALADLTAVEVGTKMIKVKGIDVFGPQRSIELVSTVNTMMAMMKIMAPLIFMLSLAVSLLGVFYIGW
jgi:putative membrane protein